MSESALLLGKYGLHEADGGGGGGGTGGGRRRNVQELSLVLRSVLGLLFNSDRKVQDQKKKESSK